MNATTETKTKVEIVGDHEQTFLGLSFKAFACALSEQLTINKDGYQSYVESDKYSRNEKIADDLEREIGEYKFFGKVPKEIQGEFVTECDSMRGTKGNEHWKLYFVKESETKSGKCYKGKLFIEKAIPIPELSEVEAVEYVEAKRNIMVPKSVIEGDNPKKFWWFYYNAIQKNSLRPWE